MAKAVNYFLNEWDGIEASADYSDVSWDNNLVERTNRYISLSRHNSLFFGSHAGAERGCIFCSLAYSCRLRWINFFEYLTDVLSRAATMPNSVPVDAYRVQPPDLWKPSQNQYEQRSRTETQLRSYIGHAIAETLKRRLLLVTDSAQLVLRS